MKKTILALSLLAVAASASAQSSATLFGVVDVGLSHGAASGAGSSSKTALVSGGLNASRLGFRGTEDLGGGMAASFWLEAGISADTGLGGATNTNNQASGSSSAPAGTQGLTFNRRSTLSLSGPWGELRLGRDFSPQFLNIATYDPSNNNGVGTTVTILAPAAIGMAPGGTGGPLVRSSNQIAYFLPPNLGGIYGQIAYFLGENARNGGATQDDGNSAQFRIGYAKGPFDVAMACGRINYAQTATTGDYESCNLGGSYNFGVVKLMGLYGRDARESSTKIVARPWMIGGIVPVGPHEFHVHYSSYKTEIAGGNGPKVAQFALGYQHNLSKRTALYVTAARVKNSNFAAGAGLTVGGAAIGATATNPSSTGFDLGMRHFF
jgi:predicted porin